MSKKSLIDGIFNKNRSENEPLTITELDSVSIEQKGSYFDKKEKYGGSMKRVFENIENYFEKIKTNIEELNEKNLPFNKKNIEDLCSSLDILNSNINGSMKYNLEKDSEHFERDFYEIKKEIQDRIISDMINVGNFLKIEDHSFVEKKECRFESYLEFNKKGNEYAEVSRLLNAYAEHIPNSFSMGNSEKRKEIMRLANNFVNEHINQERQTYDLSRATMSFTQTQSTGVYLFGENRTFSDFYTMELSFASERRRGDYEVSYNDALNLMMIYLSPYQLMELVQCSLTGTWIKGTMVRFCGNGLKEFAKYNDKKDIHLDGNFESEYKNSIKTLIEESQQLLNKPATKGSRKRLEEILNILEPMIREEIKDREKIYADKQADLLYQYSKKHIGDIEETINVISRKNENFDKEKFLNKIKSSKLLMSKK